MADPSAAMRPDPLALSAGSGGLGAVSSATDAVVEASGEGTSKEAHDGGQYRRGNTTLFGDCFCNSSKTASASEEALWRRSAGEEPLDEEEVERTVVRAEATSEPDAETPHTPPLPLSPPPIAFLL